MGKIFDALAGKSDNAKSDPTVPGYFASPGDPENQFGEDPNYPPSDGAQKAQTFTQASPLAEKGEGADATQFKGTSQIPYRGAEQHGVAYSGNNQPISPDEGHQLAPVSETDISWTETPDIEPIPVRIVSTEAPKTIRRKISMFTFPVVAPANANHPAQSNPRVLSYRPNRIKAHIVVKANGGATTRVWFSPDEGFVNASGYPVDGTNTASTSESFDTATTEDLYASLDSGAAFPALVCVYEEYEVEIGNPEEHAKKGSHGFHS